MNQPKKSFAQFINSKYSNFHLYCCPKRIFLLENGQNYSSIQGLYSKSWDFVTNPGTLFQILGLYSTTLGLYSKSWDFTPPPWDFNTRVLIFHLICHSRYQIKLSFLLSWRSSQVAFLVIPRSFVQLIKMLTGKLLESLSFI